MRPDEIVAVVVVASFAAGLNVYATVATLGLLAQADILQLPHGLHLLSSWPVIIVAALLFVVEFFADKIPAFDLVWNALQTFIRVPVAALISYGATAEMSPEVRVLATAIGAAVALAAHSGKTAVRAAVTPSPEPASNIALSLGEDATAIGLTWFATAHPFIALGAVIVLLFLCVMFIRWAWRGMRRGWRRLFSHRSQPGSPSRPTAAA
jgi:hypothetical protein